MLNKERERKVIFIVDYKDSLYLGYPSQMSMLPVKTVKRRDIYIKQTRLHEQGYYPSNTICRESMIAYIITQLSENPYKRTIDMLMVVPKGYEDRLDKGVKLANHYEELFSWNKTRTYSVNKFSKIKETQGRYKNFSFILVVIPNKWLYSPQLLSLYLMFLKIAEVGFKCEFKTHKELMNQLDTFFTEKHATLSGFLSGFCNRIKSSYKYWDTFLYNLDALFKNKTRKFNHNMGKSLQKLYEKGDVGFKYSMHLDGISNLIIDKSYDKQLGKDFSVLKETVKNG